MAKPLTIVPFKFVTYVVRLFTTVYFGKLEHVLHDILPTTRDHNSPAQQ